MYYSWSKEFLEAGKRRLAGDTARAATTDEVKQLDPNDARRQVWHSKWPGEEDCERFRFYNNGDLDFPDLTRLFTDCVWDADTGRWERKQ
jgi:hypothetical protein